MLKRTFKLPDGKTADFDIIKSGAVVCTLALTPDKKVILVRQFRAGPEKILTEMPGGFIDKGESPKAAAKRELLERSGYTGEFKFIGVSRRAHILRALSIIL